MVHQGCNPRATLVSRTTGLRSLRTRGCRRLINILNARDGRRAVWQWVWRMNTESVHFSAPIFIWQFFFLALSSSVNHTYVQHDDPLSMHPAGDIMGQPPGPIASVRRELAQMLAYYSPSPPGSTVQNHTRTTKGLKTHRPLRKLTNDTCAPNHL